MTVSLLQRLALLLLALNGLWIGTWAQFAPASFYASFPGNGFTWVSVDGPYNEHLIRDVGGLYLAIAVLAFITLLRPTLSLLRATALATLVYQVPHGVYHLIHVNLIPTTLQQVLQSAALLLGVVASFVLLVGSRQPTKES